MTLDFFQQLPADFDDTSRVWIYQCNRMFLPGEAMEAGTILQQFAASWKSHGAEVKGYAGLLFGQFIIIMADERATGVSGCSTDSSVRVIKQIEQTYNVQLFDRQSLAFIIEDKIQLLPLSQLNDAVVNNTIDADTLYFNNIIETKKELPEQWIIPVKNSWIAKRVSFAEVVK